MDDRDEHGRFLPGVSGNPNGRTKFSLVTILKEKLQSVPEGEKRTVAEILIESYLANAFKTNDGVAIRDFLDRVDGKPKQHLTVDDQTKEDSEFIQEVKKLREQLQKE